MSEYQSKKQINTQKSITNSDKNLNEACYPFKVTLVVEKNGFSCLNVVSLGVLREVSSISKGSNTR